MNKGKYIFLLLMIFGLSNKTLAQVNTFLKNKVDSIFAKEKIPGIVVGLSNGKNTEFYTAGYSNPETKKQFDENTFFEIGSITKTFTAYVLMAVLRDYKIKDTVSIINFLPDSVKINPTLADISFLKLMNHTSGLPRLPDNFILEADNLQPYKDYNSNLLFAYLKKAQPKNKNKYAYSNLGMGLAGVLAERISGKTYAALLDKYIFLPFKIVDAKNSIEKSENKSQGYFDNTTSAAYWNMNVLAPAGGIKSTTKEMLKYLACMSKPINKKSQTLIDTLLQPTAEMNKNIKIGRAWHIIEQKDKPTIYWHNGGTYGFSTFAAFIKGTNQTVIIAINKFNSNAICDKLGIEIIKKLASNE